MHTDVKYEDVAGLTATMYVHVAFRVPPPSKFLFKSFVLGRLLPGIKNSNRHLRQNSHFTRTYLVVPVFSQAVK